MATLSDKPEKNHRIPINTFGIDESPESFSTWKTLDSDISTLFKISEDKISLSAYEL